MCRDKCINECSHCHDPRTTAHKHEHIDGEIHQNPKYIHQTGSLRFFRSRSRSRSPHFIYYTYLICRSAKTESAFHIFPSVQITIKAFFFLLRSVGFFFCSHIVPIDIVDLSKSIVLSYIDTALCAHHNLILQFSFSIIHRIKLCTCTSCCCYDFFFAGNGSKTIIMKIK